MKKIPPEPAASLTDVFHTHVTLQHTDAVGVLFAASPITWAQLGFENLMRAAGHPLETVLWAETHYPIVKLTIEHQRKLTLGTEICVETYIERVGNRSVDVRSDVTVSETGDLACCIRRTGVAVGQDGSAVPAEQWMRDLARPPT